jgi:hypothetical protein
MILYNPAQFLCNWLIKYISELIWNDSTVSDLVIVNTNSSFIGIFSIGIDYILKISLI